MKCTWLTLFVVSLVLATAVPAGASRGRAAATLQLAHASLKGKFTAGDCPQGSPSGDICWSIANAGTVRGLGAVAESGVLFVASPNTQCEKWTSEPVLTVAGKGTITLSVRAPGDGCVACACSGQARVVSLVYTVTGGTGAYGGASGSGTITTTGVAIGLNGSDTFAGSIVVPSGSFDLTPPVIRGAAGKTVRAAKGASSVRVRYAVQARDAVDGVVPATCRPASGHAFRIGRTRVSCTASDSSANVAAASFTITVQR